MNRTNLWVFVVAIVVSGCSCEDPTPYCGGNADCAPDCRESGCSGSGFVCNEQTGFCECAAGTTQCSSACVDLQSDPDHCGGCDISCGGEACGLGVCGACASGWMVKGLRPASFAVKEPYVPAVGDLNGDGLLDVAVSSFGLFGDGRVHVLKGRGDFTFDPPVVLEAVGHDHLAAVDVNGDGRLDLLGGGAALSGGSYVLRSFVNLGDGGFELFETPTGPTPGVFATGDVNLDGKLDVAISILHQQTATPDTRVHLHFGNGDGTFSAARRIEAIEPLGLALADLDGDGLLDLATSEFDRSAQDLIRILRNTDGGYFEELDSHAVNWSRELRAGDLNGDGLTDLAAAAERNNMDGGVYVLFNRPSAPGTFTPPKLLTSALGVQGLQLADLNRDGRLELLARGGPASSPVHVFQGLGDGGFSAPRSYGAGTGTNSFAIGDFTGDSFDDVLFVSNQSIALLENMQDGGLFAPREIPTGAEPYAIALGRFDDDAIEDLTVAGRGGTLEVLKGLGGTSFSSLISRAIAVEVRGAEMADFNGDGREDVAVSHQTNISLYPNTGSDLDFATLLTGASEIQGLGAADFDGDGLEDLACASTSSGQVFVYTTTGTTEASYFTGRGPTGVATGDLNGDGAQDLVAAAAEYRSFAALVNKGGDAGFVSEEAGDIDAGAGAVALGDVDRDGQLDAVVTSPEQLGMLTLLRGDGSGEFASPAHFALPERGHAVVAADLNRDGRADAITAHFAGSAFAVSFANADGGFDPAQVYPFGTGIHVASLRLPGSANGLAVQDVSGDGQLDVVLASPGSDRVLIFEGVCR